MLTSGVTEAMAFAKQIDDLIELKEKWDRHVEGFAVVEVWVERGLLESLPQSEAPPGMILTPGIRVHESVFGPPGRIIGRRADGTLVIWKADDADR